MKIAKKNKFKIINPMFINPFFMYSLFWIIAYILYIISPSKYNTSLKTGLNVFIILTIIISVFCSFIFSNKIKGRTIEIKKRNVSNIAVFALCALYVLEFIYSKDIPLFSSGSTYKDFGIPTLHVVIVTFSVYYFVYNILYFNVFYDKKNFLTALIILFYFVLIYSRGMIIFSVVSAACIILVSHRIKLRTILLALIMLIIGCWLFGILGNIRSGYEWNDSHLILYLAGIDMNRYNLLAPFYWVEEYFVACIRNLNYNLNYEPTYLISNLLYSIFPDFVMKRIVSDPTSIRLAVAGFTVGTTYAFPYVAFGYLGMVINYLLYFIVTIFFMLTRSIKIENRIIALSLMTFIMAMSMFDNMIVYSGYSFSLVFAFLCGIRIRKK